MTSPNGLHVVMTGYDDTVFVRDAPSDTLERQCRYAQELERQRPGSRLTVLILTPRPAQPIRRDNASFVPVRVFPGWRRPALFRSLRRLAREVPIDVLTCQTPLDDAWACLLFGRLRRVPVVGQIHFDIFSPWGQREHFGTGLVGRWRLAVALRRLRRCTAVRVVGERIRTRLQEQLGCATVSVIPVPVTLDAATPATDSAASPRSVLFVGRLEPQKNLDLWLKVATRVAAQVPDAVLDIVGDGSQRQRLEAAAGALGLGDRVRFHGAIPYNRVGEFYGRAAAFLLTSHYEGFGRVLVESYLHGVPAVGPRITGVEDVIVHGSTGFLVEPGDDNAFSEAVVRLLQDDELRRRMGDAGRDDVRRRFSPEHLCREWIALLVRQAEDRRGLRA